MEKITISIFGATGLIGKALVNYLLAEKYSIRIFSRSPSKASKVFPEYLVNYANA